MKILIVYYSLYGHTQKLAKAVEESARRLPARKYWSGG